MYKFKSIFSPVQLKSINILTISTLLVIVSLSRKNLNTVCDRVSASLEQTTKQLAIRSSPTKFKVNSLKNSNLQS